MNLTSLTYLLVHIIITSYVTQLFFVQELGEAQWTDDSLSALTRDKELREHIEFLLLQAISYFIFYSFQFWKWSLSTEVWCHRGETDAKSYVGMLVSL